MKAQRSGFHSEKEEQVRAAELSAQREAERSALGDDAALSERETSRDAIRVFL